MPVAKTNDGQVVTKEKKLDYKKDIHEKSIKDILKDSVEREQEPVEEVEEKKPEPVAQKPEEKKPEAPNPVEAKAIAEEAAEKAAQKALEAAKKAQEAEQAKVVEKEQKVAEDDELTPIWVKEKRPPKDWIEHSQETTRIAELKAERRVKEILSGRDAAEQQKREEAEKAKQAQQEAEKQRVSSLEQQINEDLNKLRNAKELPPIVNAEDPNDAGRKAQDALIDFGIKLNVERAKRGESPIASLTELNFYYYKPSLKETKKTEQPAGADAPIAGSQGSPNTAKEPEGYVYARDHNKSFKQMLYEAKQRMMGNR